jgi:hypothetical protein
VFFLVFGSSASGKTSALNLVRDRVARLAVHDFDEVGVPAGADMAWRHHTNELWVQRALAEQEHGRDFVLGGQTPLGELLATTSAPRLDAISACLIDCDDTTRLERLRARGPEWLARTGGDVTPHLGWADWMRRHAADPSWRPDVIHGSEEEWAHWHADDPRWRVQVIDTTSTSVDEVASQLVRWIAEERAGRG